MIELTKNQCRSLADFIDFYLLSAIREDTEIDNLAWVHDIITAWKIFDRVANGGELNADEQD